MKPKIIKSRKEHADALARIEKLMDAAPGSPEEEELALRAPLVECYEEKNFPLPAPLYLWVWKGLNGFFNRRIRLTRSIP